MWVVIFFQKITIRLLLFICISKFFKDHILILEKISLIFINTTLTCTLRQHIEWMGNAPPPPASWYFWSLSVCMALKTLWCCGYLHRWNKGMLWGPYTPLTPPPNLYPLAWGVVAHPFDVLPQGQGLMWGTRGAFWLVVAMVMVVVMQFCVVVAWLDPKQWHPVILGITKTSETALCPLLP